MKPEFFHDHAIVPAMSLLPARMNSPAARVMILAICLQESDLASRKQISGYRHNPKTGAREPVYGPARSYAMFEFHSGALLDVLNKPSTKQAALDLCAALDVEPTATAIYEATEFNDVLAAGVTRLFLWTSPLPLPGPDDTAQSAYQKYLAIWRPGKLSPERWPPRYQRAWEVINRS